MYSEEDINSAVAAGALDAQSAAKLREHISAVRELPAGDEESFRLVTSFNDIFVAIGIVILLIAVGSITVSLELAPAAVDGSFYLVTLAFLLPSAAIAATAWGLAEIFTRRRRMALPSIILLIAFVWSVFLTTLALAALPLGAIAGIESLKDDNFAESQLGDAFAIVLLVAWMLVAGSLTVFAAWRHWRRFMVPITVAVGASAMVVCVLGAIALADQVLSDGRGALPMLPLVLIAGLAVFAFAMRWDMSDRTRTTRRSDVAFWLHLLAAPMIAHPLFATLGVMDGGSIGIAGALGVIAIYLLFGLVALAIDRRALLVSALAYVLAALTFLFDRFGAVELNFALTALVIGSALLTLSALWGTARARVVAMLPGDWQARLPVTAPLAA